MLSVRDLRAGYGESDVLRGVSIAVGPGEAVGVLGANGAGKTTLMRVISGLMPVRDGTIVFEDVDIGRHKTHAICELGLIHVPEGRKLFPRLTVLENLMLGAIPGGPRRRARTNLADVFDRFPMLAERSGQLAGTLSGGEQQQLAFGRGLMSEPRLLILDEPTLGLSPLLAKEIFRSVKDLNDEGLAILMVSQEVSGALKCVERAYVLENGNIELSGNADDLQQSDEVRAAYLGL